MQNLLRQLKIDLRIKVGYGAAFILLLISYVLTWYANKNLMLQSEELVHTNKVITHLTELGSYMKDAETGVRGYMITKDRTFLEPYETSSSRVNSTFATLKSETKDNTDQQILLYKIKGLIDNKYDVMQAAKLSFEKSGFLISDSAVRGPFTGKLLMDSIRSNLEIMKTREQERLATRIQKLDTQYLSMNIIIITSLALAFLFAILGFITYRRESDARQIADKKVSAYQQRLQEQIEELDIANKELVQMRRTEKFAATGRIARTIAHEVRNPLTNIDLAVSQIKAEIPATEEIDNLFEMVDRNSKRINQLITELLNATRFAELNFQSLPVNGLLDEALELARDRIELKHITVKKQMAEGLLPISVDPSKIRIAFLNIIVNAVEAMEPGKGILTILTTKENGKLVVEISDNGIGMDAASLGNLFEPYYTTKSDGNGLGLTNTQNIILNHKGSINVESKLSEGTKFIIKFEFAAE